MKKKNNWYHLTQVINAFILPKCLQKFNYKLLTLLKMLMSHNKNEILSYLKSFHFSLSSQAGHGPAECLSEIICEIPWWDNNKNI